MWKSSRGMNTFVFYLLCWQQQKKSPFLHADDIVTTLYVLVQDSASTSEPIHAMTSAPLVCCLGHISPIFHPILPLWLLIPAVKWRERNKGIGLVSVLFCPWVCWMPNSNEFTLRFFFFLNVPCVWDTTMFCWGSACLWIKVWRTHTCVSSLPT